VSYVSEVLADSPFSFYRFADFTDSSGNGNGTSVLSSGPTVGHTSIVTGDSGAGSGMAQFNGSGYLAWPFPVSTDLTIEYWIIASACDETVGGNYPSFRVGNTSSVGPCTPFADQGTIFVGSSVNVSDGGLHHVVYVWTGATIEIFVDGVSTGTATRVRPVGGGGSLGGYGGGPWYTGQMSDMAVYATALSSARIGVHYTAGTSAAPTNVVRTADDTMVAIIDTATLAGTTVHLTRTTADTMAAITDAVTGATGRFLNAATLDVLMTPQRPAWFPQPAAGQDPHVNVEFKSFGLFDRTFYGRLQIDGATWTETYNTKPGDLRGTVAITPDVRLDALAVKRLLVVVVDDQPRAAYVLQKVEYDSVTATATIFAEDVWTAFYDKYPILDAFTVTAVDEITGLLFELYEYVSELPDSDIGLTLDLADSGIPRTVAINPEDSTQTLGAVVGAHIVSIEDGAQIRIDVIYTDATETPTLVLRARHPTLGRRYETTNPDLLPVFKYLPTGGNIVSVKWQNDGTTYATKVYGVTSKGIFATSVNAGLRASGLPEQVFTMTRQAPLPQDTMQARTDAALAARGTAFGISTVVVTMASVTQQNLVPGDDAIFVLQDALWFTDKLVAHYRITEIAFDADAETAELSLDPSATGDLAEESVPASTNPPPPLPPRTDVPWTPFVIGQELLSFGHLATAHGGGGTETTAMLPFVVTTGNPLVRVVVQGQCDIYAGFQVTIIGTISGGVFTSEPFFVSPGGNPEAGVALDVPIFDHLTGKGGGGDWVPAAGVLPADNYYVRLDVTAGAPGNYDVFVYLFGSSAELTVS
jgi:hypothetical protein